MLRFWGFLRFLLIWPIFATTPRPHPPANPFSKRDLANFAPFTGTRIDEDTGVPRHSGPG